MCPCVLQCPCGEGKQGLLDICMLPRTISLVCYFVALSGCGAFALFVLLLGLHLDDLAVVRLPLKPAWAADNAWLVLFSVQHSGMARAAFKRFWLRVFPAKLERSIYAALSGLLLLI